METTDFFGIPVPSTDPVFLTFVVGHIAISLVAVITGLLAMFAEKTSIRHKKSGSVYFWSISFLADVSCVVLLCFPSYCRYSDYNKGPYHSSFKQANLI